MKNANEIRAGDKVPDRKLLPKSKVDNPLHPWNSDI